MTSKRIPDIITNAGIEHENAKGWIDCYADVDDEIHLKDDYYELDSEQQLLVLLLAAYILERQNDTSSESMSPVTLSEITGGTLGETYPVIRNLEKKELIENVGRAYRINPQASDRIKESISSTGTTLAD